MKWRVSTLMRLVILPFLVVAAIDLAAWLVRDRQIFALPAPLLIFVGSLAATCIILLFSLRLGKAFADIKLPPDGARYRAGADDTEVMLQLERQVLDKLRVIEETYVTRTQVQDVKDYLSAMEQTALQRAARDRIWQRNQAIITTLIGLFGGWIPYIIQAVSSLNFSH